jgi:hypothetical protein
MRVGVHPSDKIQKRHQLFVEGKDDSLDSVVINVLFGNRFKIESLGPCYSVRSAATALARHNPNYYFLIDRDHQKIEDVENSWREFQTRAKNILIWRRREIENYFIEPDFLKHSESCRVSERVLQEKILEFANNRLFIDVANDVIVSICEEFKRSWIDTFSDVEKFSSRETSLNMLKELQEFDRYSNKVRQLCSHEELETRFCEYFYLMTGGQERLSFGVGDWINMVSGKKILHQVIHSNCFKTENKIGEPLQGQDKVNEIAKELLIHNNYALPSDFVKLKRLIFERMGDPIDL